MKSLEEFKKLAADVVKTMDDDYGCHECGAVGLDAETRKLAEAVERLIAVVELTLYYVEGDATWEALKEQVERILAGGDSKGAPGDGED